MVRGEVAGNLNTPVETLKGLTKDVNEFVRRNATRNPNTPIDLSKELSNEQQNASH